VYEGCEFFLPLDSAQAAVHAGCWKHCRRGFANVLNPGDAVATPMVKEINARFAIDAAAREQV